MDLLLLGAMAVVLIALTVWLVWHPSPEAARPDVEANPVMTPMGDQFEDQYTSATGDLSAGGVAVTNAAAQEEPATEAISEPPTAWPEAAVAPMGSAPGPEVNPSGSATGLDVTPTGVSLLLESQAQRDSTGPQARTPKSVGMGAVAALTLGGAAAGAWLYAQWQRERNKPINRLRRRFR